MPQEKAGQELHTNKRRERILSDYTARLKVKVKEEVVGKLPLLYFSCYNVTAYFEEGSDSRSHHTVNSHLQMIVRAEFRARLFRLMIRGREKSVRVTESRRVTGF